VTRLASTARGNKKMVEHGRNRCLRKRQRESKGRSKGEADVVRDALRSDAVHTSYTNDDRRDTFEIDISSRGRDGVYSWRVAQGVGKPWWSGVNETFGRKLFGHRRSILSKRHSQSRCREGRSQSSRSSRVCWVSKVRMDATVLLRRKRKSPRS
jgi:hypothetical protein